MVGGIVKEVLIGGDRVWINCVDREHPTTECAIYVERNADSENVRKGDSVWWQGRFAMWSEKEWEGRGEIEIPRIGYSGARHPAQSLIEAAFGG